MSSLRTQSTGGGVLGLSSVGSDRTGATSTAAGSHSHSHRKHHHHHRSRSAPRAPEKPPRKRHLNPGHSFASIPSQIKLSMLNSGLISFDIRRKITSNVRRSQTNEPRKLLDQSARVALLTSPLAGPGRNASLPFPTIPSSTTTTEDTCDQSDIHDRGPSSSLSVQLHRAIHFVVVGNTALNFNFAGEKSNSGVQTSLHGVFSSSSGLRLPQTQRTERFNLANAINPPISGPRPRVHKHHPLAYPPWTLYIPTFCRGVISAWKGEGERQRGQREEQTEGGYATWNTEDGVGASSETARNKRKDKPDAGGRCHSISFNGVLVELAKNIVCHSPTLFTTPCQPRFRPTAIPSRRCTDATPGFHAG
ncbi:hypothetical protein WN48_00811 [Eufriesea mexicana]|nr:hypothetical protein WN48_00811 [Eufriesea mexicana]